MENKTYTFNVKSIEDLSDRDAVSKIFNGDLTMTTARDGTFVFGVGELDDNDSHIPEKVIYNRDATIAIFPDGKKVVSRPMGDDEYDREVGLAMCIAKHVCGGRKKFLQAVEKAEVQTNKPAKGGVLKAEAMAKLSWRELGETSQSIAKKIIEGFSGETLTKLTAHKPYWHELDRDMRNILLRMLHSGHPDMVEIVNGYAKPDWCMRPEHIGLLTGCRPLEDGYVRYADAQACSDCRYNWNIKAWNREK